MYVTLQSVGISFALPGVSSSLLSRYNIRSLFVMQHFVSIGLALQECSGFTCMRTETDSSVHSHQVNGIQWIRMGVGAKDLSYWV